MTNPWAVVMPADDDELVKPAGTLNQAGRDGKLKARMLRYARGKSIKAIKHLVEIMDNKDNSVVVRKDAAIAVLNRAWGAPRQEIEIADQGATLEEMLTAIWAAKRAQVADNVDERMSTPLTIEHEPEPSE